MMAEAGPPGNRDITVRPRSAPEGSAFYTDSWALVVGLNRYEDKRIPELQFAEQDAEDIASLLPSLGFPTDNIRIVLGSRMMTIEDCKRVALTAKSLKADICVN